MDIYGITKKSENLQLFCKLLTVTAHVTAHEESGLQCNGTRSSLATNLSSGNNLVRVWRPRGEHVNPAFDLQQHTAPTAGVMVWGAIAYSTQSPLVLIRGTMTPQWYTHDILQTHVLPLMKWLPGAIFQQDNARFLTARVSQDSFRTVTIFFG
ncbi:transposable element Tcb2 transposase [Trichonephila clavipes]|uniref:Transposable element Tcb2 transposase n=1 Tax=Trichonephila clavipes TaxID=2585209 RepID=A0A8X6SV79_TRICX|nr:transposable element Tcb2 transposase [Trichonephila clavipes]